MKSVLLLVLIASVSFARLTTLSNSLENADDPLLLSSRYNYYYLQNNSDTAITIPNVDVQIIQPGLEESWYWYFYIDSYSFAYADSGKPRARSNVAIKRMEPMAKFYFANVSFEAKKWWYICSDYYNGKDRCSPEGGKASNNTANEHDTIDVQMIFYWYYTDYPRRDSNKVIQLDSTILPCRLEYFRGPTSSEMTLGISGHGARSKDGIRSVSQGWQVPAGGHWTLRNLEGREIPLRQESTNDGVLLLPQGLHGVGVLTGPNGQASKVHGLGGN
jgi:hypothetical protein